MADVKTITDSNGNTRNICDQTARDSISQAAGKYSSNVNDIEASSVMYCTSGATNLPVSGGGLLITGASTSIRMQMFLNYSGSRKLYARGYSSGSWSEWAEL